MPLQLKLGEVQLTNIHYFITVKCQLEQPEVVTETVKYVTSYCFSGIVYDLSRHIFL